ncbi:hypothetical protein SAMN04488498_102435 [Mesorhizobium albiziae]|uniref:DUF1284 domain-containing protein n=1 Tax=Neomesorhizobium albiziae TaxID=335020 RepID=A0A1I3WR93_9HYPH|nr:DUF1284 domain-containing protein [Mesorhizobium albiziae]GLS31831.1 (2Fe-2S) ferredoxin [Mesorhizobium albiziae]SFK09972.1 hypothetical protein SAMN04488498_102435 [Mesorhizobium albiziae]
MTLRLRAHHLLCMLTYVGKGYGAAFVDNYDAVVGRLAKGEDLLLVAGPDDICQPLQGDAQAHCHLESVLDRDDRAASAVASLLGRPVNTGERITLDAATVARMRHSFAAGRTREACTGCEWFDLCSAVAASDFDGARLAWNDAGAPCA